MKQCVVSIFFLFVLLTGLTIFKDYGVHWDEYHNQEFGQKWTTYALRVIHTNSITAVPFPKTISHDWIHGPIVEILLTSVQKYLNLNDSRDILLMRHLTCFLFFFFGIYFFYLLCNTYFNNWKIALTGCFLLILNPRIFANSFYNTVDIPFLSFYVISIYLLLKWLNKRNILKTILYAIACSILINIRLIGLIIPILTLFFFLVESSKTKNTQAKKNDFLHLFLYVVILIIFFIASFPLLWSNPYLKFQKILINIISFHYAEPFLYLGQFYKTSPWHFAPVWIIITTPLLYLFYFLIGSCISIRNLFTNSIYTQKRNNLLITLCFVTPLLLTNGKLYDDWRHLFFIYPVFLIFSLTGLSTIWNFIKNKLNGGSRLSAHSLIILITTLSLIQSAYSLIKLHPFQNVYFNSLAGKNMQEIKNNFGLDYWGSSYRQALEYILKNDSDKIIPITTADITKTVLRNTLNILSIEDKKRFKIVSLREGKYFLTNYRQHPQEYPYPEYASIKIENTKILGIYKLK